MNIGYLRYKISDLTEGFHTFDVYKNGELVARHTVKAKEFCKNYVLLKYLDSNGFYRFFPFNANFEKTMNNREIGTIETSIIDISQVNGANIIGKESTVQMNLTAENVTPEELEILSDIFVSPRVYIYNNSGLDRLSDWQKVRILTNGTLKNRKSNPRKVTVLIELPERYAITLL